MQVRIRIPGSGPPPFDPLAGDQAASIPEPPAAALPPSGSSQRRLGASSSVALGILLTRISGLIRERVMSHYFGNSAVIGVFRAAFKIPNLLNNLFGEGVLSAAFVTVYARLRALGKNDEAGHLAAAVFSILACLCAVLVLVGVTLTPYLIDLIAPGFRGADRDLTIRLVRILFPASGFLVLGAWCLGVLNSHRKFLLSYSAPIAMNASMIAVLILFARYQSQQEAIVYLAWACVVGSILTFLVQLPSVLQLLPAFRPVLDLASSNVRTVIRNFIPVFISRGVVQVSSYIDLIIATFLGAQAVSALGYGQILAVLPVSLFSMSISAAELPELSSAVGERQQIAAQLRQRLASGLRRIAFFVVPCAVAFLVIGDVLIAALLQTGRFDYGATVYVWSVLAGSAVGLLATSLGRLYSSVFYALHDTRTPLRFSLVRVVLTTGLGLLFAFYVPGWLGIDPKWGVAGLTTSAGIAGWVEFSLLRWSLARRIGATPRLLGFSVLLWIVAFASVLPCYWIKITLGVRHPLPLAAVIIPLYMALYFAGTALLRVPEAKAVWHAVLRQLGFR